MRGGVALRSVSEGQEPLDQSRERSVILHVDMDAFFASVSELDHPEHQGKPLVVGAGARGVVLSANYAARKFGIRAAMPVAKAQRMAPQAVFIPPDHKRYSDVSERVMEIFHRFTPKVEPLSLDEAFLDVTGSRRLFGSGLEIAKAIRHAVATEERITCSVGIATSKFIAKLASGKCKPDGMLEIDPGRVLDFLHPLPVGDVWGVGPKTNEILQNLGLRTVADLANTPLATLKRALGDSSATSLYELAWGRDYRDVISDEPEKSISAAETFAYDLDDSEEILTELLRLTERATLRLRKSGFRASTVTLRIRFADFKTITRSKSLDQSVDGTLETFALAKQLFLALKLDGVRIRLVGIGLEGLIPSHEAPEQLELGAPDRGWREAVEAVDKALDRFGKGSIRPARLIEPGEDSE
ncbi:MAG: DNA polymerase IV [Actinobacteria bacterium]|nr:DNA polymerase IV [Actinomycetota bacterium]